MTGRINVKRRITAAVEGARTAGLDVARVEVDKDGRVVIITGKLEESTIGAGNPWDEVLAHAANEKRPS